MGYKRVHQGCGGEVKGRKCQKCGKVWKVVGYYLAKDIEDKQELRFDPDAYRKRIRNREDIP